MPARRTAAAVRSSLRASARGTRGGGRRFGGAAAPIGRSAAMAWRSFGSGLPSRRLSEVTAGPLSNRPLDRLS
jgi:hypothetical protein